MIQKKSKPELQKNIAQRARPAADETAPTYAFAVLLLKRSEFLVD
jgi:hypothetical protein